MEVSLLIAITAGISMVLFVMIAITYLLIRQGKMAKELAAAAARKKPGKRSAKAHQGGKGQEAPLEGTDADYLDPVTFKNNKSAPFGKHPHVPGSPTVSEHIYEDPDYDMESNQKVHHYENAKSHTYANTTKPLYAKKENGTRGSSDSSENNYARSSSSSLTN
ncbi:unnamed protein product [Meganyctiphanes norvegica]|uniref:Uncharacterized protein n=1 Tax=Meganyctiphanes norvegica TaxID=48144 RepID=A0AAV2S789_MEGNR